MAILAGAKVDAVDFDTPDVVTAFGNAQNTITSGTFAALPTAPTTASITNPHPTANLLAMVGYGAWMQASTGDVRAALDVSGALTIAAGIGGGAAIGYGEMLFTSSANSTQCHATISLSLPPGTTTLKVFSMRTGAGTVLCNYATIRIVPVGYIF